ncbi:MAG: type VI secretion system baseplate subunit TssF [Saprospiraceae bacterium]|jgi:hypothetical protein|nr:type VI secretion system baseplate subunit TssF [Saprospiraceae bacterium]
MDTREEIRSRMLRDVARIWGYQETEMDEKAFDPVVGLLIGACASEFERLQQEMGNSRQRVLEQLATTLTPEVLMTPTPAHAVLHVRALEPETFILPTHQVYYSKTVGDADKEIYFSTAEPYRLVNGCVRYVAAGGKVFDVQSDMPRREKVLESDTFRKNRPAPTFWIGLELDARITALNGISFFFNWKNDPRLRSFLRQLPYCRWYIGARELATETGVRPQYPPQARENSGAFTDDFSPAQRTRRRVQAYYQPHFITLRGSATGDEFALENLKKNYPEEFESLFPHEDLLDLKEKVLWLRVEFPEYFPVEALVNTECLINCVPVLNKQFHSENYRLPELINILPLHCDDFFFDVHRVVNEQDIPYAAHPLANLRNLETGTYTLRTRGAGKMDSRAASQHLYHLLDLLRDESAAFAAYDLNTMNEKIRNLNKEIAALEQQVREADIQREEVPYLVVKPPKGARNPSAVVEFWSTTGELANDIPSGLKLDMYATRGFDRNSILLVMPTTGGSNRKSASVAFYEFKKSLTTRDRIVSKEDIKTFCFAAFGKRLEQVFIQKGLHISDLPHEGMVRTLDVILQPAATLTPQDMQDWNALCFELETELNEKSSGLLPIRVLTNDINR